VVCVIENHQAWNDAAHGHANIWAGAGGGAVGTIPVQPELQTEINWWASIASAYASNPYVWFGTCNEPTITDGNGTYGDLAGLATWQQSTYNAIRGAGNNNIVECETTVPSYNGSSGYTASVYGAMTNVVWGPHFYSWTWGSDTTSVSESTILNSRVNSTNSTWGGIVQQIAAQQTIKSKDGVMPCGAFEFGNSTTGGFIDTSGEQLVQAVIAAVAQGTLFGFLAWWAETGSVGDQLVVSKTQLTSPYGTDVAAAIATNPTS